MSNRARGDEQYTEKELQMKKTTLEREESLKRMLLQIQHQQNMVPGSSAGAWNGTIGYSNRENVGVVLPEQPLQPTFNRYSKPNSGASNLFPGLAEQQHMPRMGGALPPPHHVYASVPQYVYAPSPPPCPQQPQPLPVSYIAYPNVMYEQHEQQRLRFLYQQHQDQPRIYTASMQYPVTTTATATNSHGEKRRNDGAIHVTNDRSDESLYIATDAVDVVKRAAAADPLPRLAKRRNLKNDVDVEEMPATLPAEPATPVPATPKNETLLPETESRVEQAKDAVGGPKTMLPPEVLYPSTCAYGKIEQLASRVHVTLKEWLKENGPEHECSFQALCSDICCRMGLYYSETEPDESAVFWDIRACLLVMYGLGLIKKKNGDKYVVAIQTN